MCTKKALMRVELVVVVVVAILAIAATFANPCLQRNRIYGNLKRAARDLTSFIALLAHNSFGSDFIYKKRKR